MISFIHIFIQPFISFIQVLLMIPIHLLSFVHQFSFSSFFIPLLSSIISLSFVHNFHSSNFHLCFSTHPSFIFIFIHLAFIPYSSIFHIFIRSSKFSFTIFFILFSFIYHSLIFSLIFYIHLWCSHAHKITFQLHYLKQPLFSSTQMMRSWHVILSFILLLKFIICCIEYSYMLHYLRPH